VGGMGIMNIMSTSVLERTREIGIRKALGAGRREILLQFLLEAIFISTIGGILGLLLGLSAAYALVLFSGIPLHPSWPMALIAMVVSIGVGLVSGYYPALRAANLKPVEALRFE
jgi:putative ABC transport system permease protein